MTDGMTASKEKGKRPSWTIQIKTEEALRFESNRKREKRTLLFKGWEKVSKVRDKRERESYETEKNIYK